MTEIKHNDYPYPYNGWVTQVLPLPDFIDAFHSFCKVQQRSNDWEQQKHYHRAMLQDLVKHFDLPGEAAKQMWAPFAESQPASGSYLASQEPQTLATSTAQMTPKVQEPLTQEHELIPFYLDSADLPKTQDQEIEAFKLPTEPPAPAKKKAHAGIIPPLNADDTDTDIHINDNHPNKTQPPKIKVRQPSAAQPRKGFIDPLDMSTEKPRRAGTPKTKKSRKMRYFLIFIVILIANAGVYFVSKDPLNLFSNTKANSWLPVAEDELSNTDTPKSQEVQSEAPLEGKELSPQQVPAQTPVTTPEVNEKLTPKPQAQLEGIENLANALSDEKTAQKVQESDQELGPEQVRAPIDNPAPPTARAEQASASENTPNDNPSRFKSIEGVLSQMEPKSNTAQQAQRTLRELTRQASDFNIEPASDSDTALHQLQKLHELDASASVLARAHTSLQNGYKAMSTLAKAKGREIEAQRLLNRAQSHAAMAMSYRN